MASNPKSHSPLAGVDFDLLCAEAARYLYERGMRVITWATRLPCGDEHVAVYLPDIQSEAEALVLENEPITPTMSDILRSYADTYLLSDMRIAGMLRLLAFTRLRAGIMGALPLPRHVSIAFVDGQVRSKAGFVPNRGTPVIQMV